MNFEHILYEKRDRIAYVTLNRQSHLNALHPDGNREVREAFTDFRDDDDVLVAILSGAGERAFCAGNDLKYMAEHGKPGEPLPRRAHPPVRGDHGRLRVLEANHRRRAWVRTRRRVRVGPFM